MMHKPRLGEKFSFEKTTLLKNLCTKKEFDISSKGLSNLDRMISDGEAPYPKNNGG